MRCEEILSVTYVRAKRRKHPNFDHQCVRIASFIYKTKIYCSEHTSMRLLTVAKVTGIVEKVLKTGKETEYRRNRIKPLEYSDR